MTEMLRHTAARRSGLADDAGDGATQALLQEHGTFMRRLAGLQQRVSEQMGRYEQEIRRLETEVTRLRADLVIARTAMLWGLHRVGASRAGAPGPRAARTRPATDRAALMAASTLGEASAVICQTGCVGHAHPWLEVDGTCRRTGAACDAVVATTASDTDLPSSPSTRT